MTCFLCFLLPGHNSNPNQDLLPIPFKINRWPFLILRASLGLGHRDSVVHAVCIHLAIVYANGQVNVTGPTDASHSCTIWGPLKKQGTCLQWRPTSCQPATGASAGLPHRLSPRQRKGSAQPSLPCSRPHSPWERSSFCRPCAKTHLLPAALHPRRQCSLPFCPADSRCCLESCRCAAAAAAAAAGLRNWDALHKQNTPFAMCIFDILVDDLVEPQKRG
jgi:hypothetical protein